MNKTLNSIFGTEGSHSLNIANENFLKENIFEELIDNCSFHQGNFTNCSFEGCTFNNTIIRKSEITNSVFKNCHFLECQFTPRANFFETLCMNCQFSSVDLSFAFLSECEFIEINLTKIKLEGTSLVDPKTENITLNDLEVDETNSLRIKITNS